MASVYVMGNSGQAEGAGYNQRNFLDIRCGIGVCPSYLLLQVVESAKEVDLSLAMIDRLRKLALSYRLKEQVTLFVGDSADTELDHRDFMVPDKVVCCYPE